MAKSVNLVLSSVRVSLSNDQERQSIIVVLCSLGFLLPFLKKSQNNDVLSSSSRLLRHNEGNL